MFGWWLPHRQFQGLGVGNFYRNSPDRGSTRVALALLADVLAVLGDVREWWWAVQHDDLPDWLHDFLVNSPSTFARTDVWWADGTWRQDESFTCDNLEPMQIHLLRSISMALFFPELAESVLRGYAASLRPDGSIAHVLGAGCLGPPAAPGPVYLDVNIGLFVVLLWQLVRGGGARPDLLRELWPVGRRVLQHQVRRAAAYGVPNNMYSAYDWFGLERKNVTTYTAFMYMASLATGMEVARRLLIGRSSEADGGGWK